MLGNATRSLQTLCLHLPHHFEPHVPCIIPHSIVYTVSKPLGFLLRIHLAITTMSLSRSYPRILTTRWSRVCRRTFAGTARRSAEEVRIVEVGPRDGLQNEKNTISLETKLELIRRLAGTGIQTMEAGSFVAPHWVPQVSLSSMTRVTIVGHGVDHYLTKRC